LQLTLSSNHVITLITGVKTIKRQTWAAYVLRLYARSVCDTTAPLQLQLPLVVLYKCCAFTFTFNAQLTR